MKLHIVLVLCDWNEQNTWESTEEVENISAKETLELELKEYIEIVQMDIGRRISSTEATACINAKRYEEHSMFRVE